MKFRISFICLIIINISLCTLFLEYGQGFISNTFNKKLTSHFRINFRLKLFFNLTFLLHKMVCREISGYSSNTRGKPKKFISRRANNACFIAWKYNDNYTWDIIGIAWVGFQNGAWVAQKRLCKNDCTKTIVHHLKTTKNIEWETSLEIWKHFNYGNFMLWERFQCSFLICKYVSQSGAWNKIKNFIRYSSGFNIRNLFCIAWSYSNIKGNIIMHLPALIHI